MSSRTPGTKRTWENLLNSTDDSPDREASQESTDLTTAMSKEYDYQRSFQLGRFKTIGTSGDDMGIRTMLARAGAQAANLKNSKADGMTVPLTFPAKKQKSSKWSFSSIKHLFNSVLKDWIFLALLGFIMAALSFGMDWAIVSLQNGQMLLYDLVTPEVFLSLLVWVGYVVLLTMGSAVFSHYIAPQAIGSGIPEMKTILRGVILKEYLSIRTLVSKMIGLTLSLGSGLPMGKEGPFVHVASVVASQLGRLVHGKATVFENESRSGEMLAAGCAVGVACTFSAPIGGVLFSIEVTSVYFAVRNYWRGFFAATCSATLFRILKMLSVSDMVTVEAHYQTSFPPQNAFMPQELPAFAAIGVLCGCLGSLFVYFHRRTVLFLRRNQIAKKLFQRFWIIYPLTVSFFISSMSFPMGLGQFMGGEERFSHTMKEFFVNCTWTADEGAAAACAPPSANLSSGTSNKFDIHHWRGPELNYTPFMTLAIFQFVYFFLSILASTLPVASGIFMPVFVLGAALGRLIGEGMYQWFPDGFSDDPTSFVRPGVYAVVGAAAFCGAVTHTVSVAVIVFELTGQLCHLLPVMIAVLIANAIASYLQPSIYDSIIRIKNLPYLPDIPHSSSLYHQVLVEQFMVRPVVFIARDSTVGDVQKALEQKQRIRAFPLVESRESLALVGSISRSQLTKLVESKLGTKARLAEAARRVKLSVDEKVDIMLETPKRKSLAETKSLNSRSGENDDGEEPPKPADLASRRPSRFLVVPVSKPNGAPADQGPTLDSTKTGVDSSIASKILSTADKEVLFKNASNNLTVDYGKGIKGSSSVNNMTLGVMSPVSSASNSDVYHTIGDIFKSITHMSFGRPNKRMHNEFELYGEERLEWEQQVQSERIDLAFIAVDSTPFQLVEYTSLFKAHSLFSLLGLNRAYVTKKGQLIGVVALKELRFGIERVQAGNIPAAGENMFETTATLNFGVERIEAGYEKSAEAGIAIVGDNTLAVYENDCGEEDAEDDYIQPRPEVISRNATPCPSERRLNEKDMNDYYNDEGVNNKSEEGIERARSHDGRLDQLGTNLAFGSLRSKPRQRSPSTISTCSIDLTESDGSPPRMNPEEDGILLVVPQRIYSSSTDSSSSGETRQKPNRHVKIVMPDDEENQS